MIPNFIEAYNGGFTDSSVLRYTTPVSVSETQHPGVITRDDLARFQAFMFLRLISPLENPQLDRGNDDTVNQGDVQDFLELAGKAGELTEIEAVKFTELAFGFGLFDENFDLEDFQLLLEIASVVVTGGAFIVGARAVRVARAMYRTAALLDTSVVLIDLEQGEYADALFGSAFLVVDLRGLGSIADGAGGAEAGVKRALAPTEFAARVSNGTVDLADAVDDLRAVGLFEAADELVLRPAGVVGSRAGDTAFVVVSGRQGSVGALLAGGGVATRPAAEKLVDDYIAAIRGGLDDPGEFDRLRGLFDADPRIAKAYARWGDDIFDAGGGVIDDLVEAVCTANSFAGDTLVAFADGTSVPIANVMVGDQVLAYDFDTGETVSRAVTATLPHEDWLLQAHLSDGSVMSVTEDHRFWSATDTAWVELQDLGSDDQLLTPDGATVTVDWLDWDAGLTALAWDLTIDQEHNFFVAADGSAEPVLVHNQTLGSASCGLAVTAELARDVFAFESSLDAVALGRWIETVDEVGGDEAIELLRVVSSRHSVDPGGAELIAENAALDPRLAWAAVRADIVDVALTNPEYADEVLSSFDKANAAMDALRRGELAVDVDPVQESLARLELQDLDAEALAAGNQGHAYSRHGADTSLEEQYHRAVTGLTPDGVQEELRFSSSRFLSNEDQLEAIMDARAQFVQAQASGSSDNAFDVPFGRVVGEGFNRFGTSYQQTDVVRVVFNDDGTVLTAFPELVRNGRDVYPLLDLPPGGP